MRSHSKNIRNLLAISACALPLLAGAAFAQETKLTKNINNEASMTSEDKYLWLEEVEGEKALTWVKSQNERSLQKLQSDKRYKKLEDEALAIIRAKDRLTFGGYDNGYVSNFWQDASQVRGLWRRSDYTSWKAGKPNWETILDFDKLSKDEGQNWVYKGSNCLDPNDLWNTNCLLSLSNGGKDANEKREFNLKTKSFVEGGFKIPEAKSAVTWVDADTLLLGTDWGEGSLTMSGYPFIVKKLKRGQDLKDAVEVFRGEKNDVSAGAYRIDCGKKFHQLFYRNPTFFTSKTFYQLENGEIAPLDLPLKHSIIGIRAGQIYFSLQEDWTPRGTNKLIMSGTLLNASIKELTAKEGAINTTIIYAQDRREALQGVSMTKSALLVTISKNVKSEIRAYNQTDGKWSFKKVDLPLNGVADVEEASIRRDEVFYSYNDFLTPPSVLMAKDAFSEPQQVQSQPARFDASGLEVNQYEATSKDGTKVPYFVVHKKGLKLNSKTPTLLYGYGGFEVSMLPSYSPYIGKLWLENGGAYVLANIRGGGEFGPEWHEAGLKLKRQVVYDDFIGVAEDLIKRKITSPRRLGAMGGSNGGLLMGVMLTQRPDLFNAIVVQVPLLDMLRYHKLLAGASWVDEYGSPDVPEERAWLEKLSPYHNLKKQKNFPEPLIVTSTKDDRVHPAHARKYAAKLEELEMPFLYYENIDGGHSAAANLVEASKRRALEYTYLMEKLMD